MKIRNFAPQIVDDVEDGVAVMRLHDVIEAVGDIWGVSSGEFTAALDSIPRDIAEIRLHINSPGGSAYHGIAILNALRAHPARVVAVVDGLAASAASFIAVGADETVMAPNSEMMIHNAWGLVQGPADDMRAMADRLDAMSANIAAVYAEKAGGDVGAWQELMTAETWFSASEAVAAGLADRVGGSAPNRVNASAVIAGQNFRYAGRANAPAPQINTQNAQPPVAGLARAQMALIRARSRRNTV